MERRFRLAGLLRLRRLEEETAAARLAQENYAIAQRQREFDALVETMAGTQFPEHGDLSAFRFAVATRGSLTSLVDEADVAVAVATRRGELATADWAAARTRVSMLDKLADRHLALVRAEDDKAEQQLLDEAAARRSIKEVR